MGRRRGKPKALGDCYRWAYHYLDKHPSARLYQGTVVPPYAQMAGERIPHAWIVHNGLVKDWQTMVAGMGGRFAGEGWPEGVWNGLWQPEDVRVYGHEQALVALLRYKHYGPWED